LRRYGITLPADILSTADPLELLRFGYEHLDNQLFKEIEQVRIAGELATEECEPTEGAHATIAACATVGRSLVVLSNMQTPSPGDWPGSSPRATSSVCIRVVWVPVVAVHGPFGSLRRRRLGPSALAAPRGIDWNGLL
jgi:hypothetical protein